MPFFGQSRGPGLGKIRPRVLKTGDKMGLPRNAYYVLTKEEASLPNSKVHPNSGAPNYNITHLLSGLTIDANLNMGAHAIDSVAGIVSTDDVTIGGDLNLAADPSADNSDAWFSMGRKGGVYQGYGYSHDNDNIFFSNEIETFDLGPDADNTRDIGGTTISNKRYKDLYLSGNLKDNTVSLTVANCKTAFDHVSVTDNPHSADTRYLKLNGSNANANIDIGSYNFKTTGSGRFDVGLLDNAGGVVIETTYQWLVGIGGNPALDWTGRVLIANDGLDEILSWATVGLADFKNSNIKTTGTLESSGLTVRQSGGSQAIRVYGAGDHTAKYGEFFINAGGSYTANCLGGHMLFTALTAGKSIYFRGDGSIKLQDVSGNGNVVMVEGGGSVYLKKDNAKLYFGTLSRARMRYDGNDLIIEPRYVGTGKLIIQGAIATGQVTVSTTTTNIDVSGCNSVLIDITSNIVLSGCTGGVAGQIVVFAYKGNYTNTVQFLNQAAAGTQKFYMHSQADETFDGGGITFVCDGSNWYDCGHGRHV